MIEKVISGGQTGVDRAALDAAIAIGLIVGGWCPRGRRAEDGAISGHYPLRETDTACYPERTRLNVRDSDGTLVLNVGPLSDGTLATIGFAKELGKPYLVIQIDDGVDVAAIIAWVSQSAVHALNVAGPRESKRPGIYAQVLPLLARVFRDAAHRPAEDKAV